jgi:hypothetical protein
MRTRTQFKVINIDNPPLTSLVPFQSPEAHLETTVVTLKTLTAALPSVLDAYVCVDEI